MAGTVTLTMSNPYAQGGENKVVANWTATAGAVVSVALCTAFAAAQLSTYGFASPQPSKFRGKLVKVETIPGANGDLTTTLPTAGYDITLLDSYSQDVAGGNLADRSGTLAEAWVPTDPIAVDDDITLTLANTGASKTGRIILHFTK
jgi:hypothetical protein